MPEVNFYLKKAEPKTKQNPRPKRLIYLQFKYGGHKLVFTFSQKVYEEDWNKKKQRVKSNKQTTSDGDHSLNDLLQNLKDVCEKGYKEEMKNGTPTQKKLKGYLVKFLNQNANDLEDEQETLYCLLDRFISGEMKSKGRTKSQGSLHNYNALKLHLKQFEIEKRSKVSFETITLDFFNKYVSFLEKKNPPLSVNTIAKDIRLLKAVMNKAVSHGLTKNVDFRHEEFSIREKEVDAVYLTDTEIIQLYRHRFDNTKLERERDRFVYGCFVGLRFSDYSSVGREHIITEEGETYIKMITQKTKELVYIPCNPIVLEIFQKYGGRPPKRISNQKFNEYVKELCKQAGLSEKGRLSTDPDKPLYECISSHTCRRSFATNRYLEGFPTIDLMKITGHNSEDAFLKYIRVSKLDTAKRLSAHMKRHWEDKLRRAERAEIPEELLAETTQN